MLALILSITIILLSLVGATVLVKSNTQTRLTNASLQSQSGIDAGTAFAVDQIHGLQPRTCVGVPQQIPSGWQNTGGTDGGMFRWWADCSDLKHAKITATVQAQTADTKFTNPKIATLCFTWVPNKGYQVTCRVSSDAADPVTPPTPPSACSTIGQQSLSGPSGILAYNPNVTFGSNGQLYLAGSIYIRRYNTDYTPDPSWSFNSTGFTTGSAIGVLPLSSGKVLAWGVKSGAKWAAILNNDGSVNTTLTTAAAVGRAAEGPDGSLYLAEAGGLEKFDANGTVQPGFASATAMSVNQLTVSNIAVIPTGKFAGQVMVAGSQRVVTSSYGLLSRLNSDGTLNTRLFFTRNVGVQAFATDPDSNHTFFTTSDGLSLYAWRVTEDGATDKTFNSGKSPIAFGDVRRRGDVVVINNIVRDEFGRYYIAGAFGNPQYTTYDGVSAAGAGFMSPGTGGSPMWVVNDDGALDRSWGTRIFNDCPTSTHGFNVNFAIGAGFWVPNGISIAINPTGDRIAVVGAGAGKYAGFLPVAGGMNYPTGPGESAGLYLIRDDGVPSKVG